MGRRKRQQGKDRHRQFNQSVLAVQAMKLGICRKRKPWREGNRRAYARLRVTTASKAVGQEEEAAKKQEEQLLGDSFHSEAWRKLQEKRLEAGMRWQVSA